MINYKIVGSDNFINVEGSCIDLVVEGSNNKISMFGSTIHLRVTGRNNITTTSQEILDDPANSLDYGMISLGNALKVLRDEDTMVQQANEFHEWDEDTNEFHD